MKCLYRIHAGSLTRNHINVTEQYVLTGAPMQYTALFLSSLIIFYSTVQHYNDDVVTT